MFLRFKLLNGSRSRVIHEKDKPFQALEEAARSFVLVWIPNLDHFRCEKRKMRPRPTFNVNQL